MSLDIYIILKKPKMVKPQGNACGSTIVVKPDEYFTDEIRFNVTHNMAEMAKHIYVDSNKENTLYKILWHLNWFNYDTNTLEDKLLFAIGYAMLHKDKLIKYNPENGWGSYESFVRFLMELCEACSDNPDCKLRISA